MTVTIGCEWLKKGNQIVTKAFEFLCLVVLICTVATTAYAQSETATISGLITDEGGGIVPNCEVVLQSVERGTVTAVKTNEAGIYVFPNVQPGQYNVTIKRSGFKQVDFLGLIVNVQDHIEQNFRLHVGSISESVTVEASGVNMNTTDGTVSTVVDRHFVENTPLNGRTIQSLILLTPGVVTNSPQQTSSSGFQGEFSVNGQRTESNYYSVDGVSANFGSALGGYLYQGNSGSLPSSTALGTTQGLVSLDSLQEFRVQSSTYSAEYGRNPGGQFSFVTRSGANQWHGTAFDYLRNDYFDANDWFNNAQGIAASALRQNDFGGTLGGPVRIPRVYDGKDKSFFFFSYEGLRLLQPQAATTSFVPDSALRASASGSLKTVLNAFPMQNGPDLGNGIAEFVGNWSNPSDIDATSVRFDQSLGEKAKLFFRFSNASSDIAFRNSAAFESPSDVSSSSFNVRTYTAGINLFLSERVANEARINYSANRASTRLRTDDFRGAVPVDLAQLQGLVSNPFADVAVYLNFDGVNVPGIEQNHVLSTQGQWNLTDTLGFNFARHHLRFGADYRRLKPLQGLLSPSVSYTFASASSVQANSIDDGSAENEDYSRVHPIFKNFSLFAQDEWRVTSRLNLSMGLRWELNPPPTAENGQLPYTVSGAEDLSTMVLAPQGTKVWQTTWFNFAPRFGGAYIVRNASAYQTVLRGGVGVYFDSGQQLGTFGYNGPGFSAFTPSFGSNNGVPASFPLSPGDVTPSVVNPPTAPYLVVYAFYPHLQLPYTLQWNASIQQSLGTAQSLTASYVGSHGDRLLQASEVNVGAVNSNFGTVFFYRNGLTSDYDALQIQYQRRVSQGLQGLASYTLSHCLDWGSQNAALAYVRGNCNFDVRNNFSGALSYDLPSIFHNRLARGIFHNWGLDGRLTVRSGFPVPLDGRGFFDPATLAFQHGGLNVIPGVPLYVYGDQFPGGRAINSAAFSSPPRGQLGDAPRNFVRGFGAWQADVAIRREFHLYERLTLQFRAEAFNVFNHPNFGTISPTLSSVQFGQATATLANSLGTLNPLYQMGGPRSMQFALRLVF